MDAGQWRTHWPRRAQELRVTWRGAWTGKEKLPGDANAETRHGGAWAFWSGRTRLLGFDSLFFARSLFSFLMLLFSALLRRPPLEPIWERRRLIT